MSRSDLEYFTQQLGYVNADFHKELYTYLQYSFGPYEAEKRFLILWPRGHGKTEIASINYPLWMIGKHPDIHINIVTKTAELSEQILGAIKTHVESNPVYNRIFPNLIPHDPQKWANNQIIVNRSEISKNPTIKATGLMGAITGGRSDLTICDDIIDEENIRTPLQIDKVQTWFNKVLYPTLQPWGAILGIGTRWHYADIYEGLLKTWPHSVKQAIIGDEKDKKVLWPAFWSYDKLVERRKEIGSLFFNCLVKGSRVLSSKGYEPIEQLHIGDIIITHKGSWENIEHIHNEQATEPIYSITVFGEPKPLQATASHKLWSFKSRKYKSKNLAPHHKGKISKFVDDSLEKSEGWHQAQELEKQDFLITPIDRTEVQPEYNNPEFWWMVGLYLADGTLNYSNGRISFALNESDKEIINRLLKITGHFAYKKTTLRNKVTQFTVDLSSKELFKFLKDFGRYSYGKHLTLEAMRLPLELQEAMWQGFVDGDGCKIKGRDAISVSSVNLDLLRQFKQILLRLNLVGCIALTMDKRQRTIQGRTVNQKAQYILKVNLKPSRHRPAEIYGDNLYSRIRKTSSEYLSVQVYNLQVAEDHSYTTPQGSVANCQYMNDPRGMQGVALKTSWLHNWTLSPVGLRYASVDPKGEGNDLFAIASFIHNPEIKKTYLYDVWAENVSQHEGLLKIKQLYEDTRPVRIFFESNALQKSLLNHPTLKGLPTTPTNTDTNKERRILAMSSHFEAGRVEVNPLLNSQRSEFWVEWAEFPRGQHDDALDSVEIGLRNLITSGDFSFSFR